jgi:hypothetical protein
LGRSGQVGIRSAAAQTETYKDLPPAAVGFVGAVAQDAAHVLALAVGLLARQVAVAEDVAEDGLRVAPRVVEDADRRLAVPASAAGLLVIALERAWQGVVDDVAD